MEWNTVIKVAVRCEIPKSLARKCKNLRELVNAAIGNGDHICSFFFSGDGADDAANASMKDAATVGFYTINGDAFICLFMTFLEYSVTDNDGNILYVCDYKQTKEFTHNQKALIAEFCGF